MQPGESDSGWTDSEAVEQFLRVRRSGGRASIDDLIAGHGENRAIRESLVAKIADAVRRAGPPSLEHLAGDELGGDDWQPPDLEGYDVVDILGMGSMGIVYEGYQRSTGRRVAIKYMLSHTARRESARRRFEREVELVARLQHPGIVPIIDSGVTEGHYFYAMEYVEGETIDRCHQVGEWEIQRAVDVVSRVVRAVEYAHQRGVLHRDLKPQNILLDPAGRGRLLDFGLAKSFDPSRQTHADVSISLPGQLVGTLAYMPPEQARGDIEKVSTRSDVYALGAIAYEMITGRLPVDVDAPVHVALSRIEHDEPPRPSALRPAVSRDLDAVLLRSLEKSPERRYASAAEFADDLDAVLGDRPVRARTPSPIERGRRWCRRHQSTTITITALLVVAIISLSLIWLNRSQRRAAALAHLQLIVDAVDGASRREASDASVAETRLDGYVRDIDQKLAGFPDYQALARQRAGQAYLEWKSYEKSRTQLDLALRSQSTLLGERSGTVGDTLHLLGRASYWLGHYDEAMAYYVRAREVRLAAYGDDDPRVVETCSHIASTSQRLGRLADAEEAYRAVVRARAEAAPVDNLALARARLNLASCLQESGRYAEALEFANAAHDMLSGSVGADPTHLARAKHSLGACHLNLGHAQPAERLLVEALDGKRREYGVDLNDDIAYTLLQLAELRLAQGDAQEAISLVHRALDALIDRFPEGHRKIGDAYLTLGWIHAFRRDWREAAAMHTLAESVLRERLGSEHQLTAEAACGLLLFGVLGGDRDGDALQSIEALVPLLRRDRTADQLAVVRVRRLVEMLPEKTGGQETRDRLLARLTD